MEDKYQKYFAYGSNMSIEALQVMGVKYKNVQPAILQNYVLVFDIPDLVKTEFGFANIKKNEGGIVKGLLMEISDSSWTILDQYEGFPDDYLKEELVVELLGGKMVNCVVYIGNSVVLKDGLLPWPSHFEIVKQCHQKYFNGY